MEYTLSYRNIQKSKNIELLFKFLNNNINDYSFSYYRDGVVLNLKYLKDLVAISKKATRSFLIFENNNFEYQKPVSFDTDLLRLKSQKPILCFPNHLAYIPVPILNTIENFLAKPLRIKYLNRFEDFLIEPLHPNYLNIYENFLLYDKYGDRISTNFYNKKLYSISVFKNKSENFNNFY